jgi:uncharacterized protein YfbU (UPF0304 family)
MCHTETVTDPEKAFFATLCDMYDILEMWSFVESSYERLSLEDKNHVTAGTALFGKPHFSGFDGDKEGELITAARLLIDHMGRFSNFKARELNSHFPSVDSHRRMLKVFLPMRRTLAGRLLTATELIEIMKERIGPQSSLGVLTYRDSHGPVN